MDTIVRKLKEIINRDGYDHLVNSPNEVYKELIDRKITNSRMAAILLHTFVMKIPSLFGEKGTNSGISKEKVLQALEIGCSLSQETSDKIAEIYMAVFTKENSEELEDWTYAGLRSFLQKEWTFDWGGDAFWNIGDHTIVCSYDAEITVKAKASSVEDSPLFSMVRSKPFVPEAHIFRDLQEELLDLLDEDYKDYCMEDDYFPPTVENYDAESMVKAWCRDCGFSLIKCQGHGNVEWRPRNVWR